MKKQIRKITLTALVVLAAFLVKGKAVEEGTKLDGKFYNSLEDFQNQKPVEGIDIVPYSWSPSPGKEIIKLTSNGKTEKKNLKEVPYNFYTYQGKLNRLFKGKGYLILVSGHYCYYALAYSNDAQYYSETISGDLIS